MFRLYRFGGRNIHAGYRKHWLGQLLSARGGDPKFSDQIRRRWPELVANCVATATQQVVTDQENGEFNETGGTKAIAPPHKTV